MSESAPDITTTDRRHFLRCSACGIASLAALAIPGCGGEGPTEPEQDEPDKKDDPPIKSDSTPVRTDTTKTNPGKKFEIIGSQIRVFLVNVPELAAFPSVFLIETAETLVVRTAAESYAAFTAICTHEGCIVSGFSDQKMVCPCHGSTYDLSGAVVVGPAPSPLASFSTTHDAAAKELLITKSN